MTSAVLAGLELELATHPRFGDPDAIRTRVAAFAELALQGLAVREATARRLLDALSTSTSTLQRHALLYPVVRDAIAVLSDGGHDSRTIHSSVRVLEVAAEAVARGRSSFAASAGPPLASASHQATLCGSPPGEEPFSQHFHGMFERKLARELTPTEVMVRTPSATELACLGQAQTLLERHVPHLFDSALAHVDLVAVIDSATTMAASPMVESASWVQFPATVFLSPLALNSARQAAESLLHEAIHHKHYDLRRCRSILARAYHEDRAQLVVAHWNEPTPHHDNRWPADRALSACHVYVTLACLHGCWASLALAQVYCERARYLAGQLHDGPGFDLGDDGRELTGWLADVVARLASEVG